MRLEQMGLPREAPCPQGACVLGLEGLDRACSMGLVASLDLVNLAAVMNSPSEIAVKAKLQHLAKDNASKAIPIYSHYVCMYVCIYIVSIILFSYYISIPIIVSSPHNVFLVEALHAAPLPPKVGRGEMGLVVLLEIAGDSANSSVICWFLRKNMGNPLHINGNIPTKYGQKYGTNVPPF
jgi:hypothetical protein